MENRKELAASIEHFRKRLYKLIGMKYSLTDPAVIAASTSLDHLIAQYQRLCAGKNRMEFGITPYT